MSKRMYIDFYRVMVEPSNGLNFATILRNVWSSSESAKNWNARDGHVLRLHTLNHFRNERSIGNLVRLRMTEVPLKGSIGGQLGSLGLQEDEGVAEETAFLYSARFNVIALQRNRYGATPNVAAYYFKAMIGDAVNSITFDPVLTPDAVRRMERIVTVRRVNIRAAGIDSSEVFGRRRNDLGVKAMGEVMNYFEAPTINMELSVGRQRRGSLAIDAVKSTVQNVLGIHRETPEKIRGLLVTGNDDEGTTDIINMLKLQMTDVYETSTKGRSIPLEERITLLRKAYSDRLSDLLQMYEVP